MVWFAKPQRFGTDQLAGMVAKAIGADLHVALAPEPVFLDDEERAAANRALDELYQAYAGRPANVDEPEFAEVAELLCRPQEARSGWISDLRNRRNRGALVADSPWFGLIAVREEDQVFVRTFRKENPSELLTAVLPEGVGRAADRPITVARTEVLNAGDQSIGARMPSRTVRRVQEIAALEPSLIAEFYAETRDAGGHRSTRPPLRVYDNAEGRWSMLIDAQDNVRLAPAGNGDIAALLDGLRRQF